MMGMFFFLTQFLQGVLGYSPLQAGFAFLPLTVALFAASQASARTLTARFGARVMMVGGISLSTAGLLWLTQLNEGSGYLSVLGPLLMFGIGNGFAFVPLTSAALSGVDPAHAGAASGLVNVMQQLGGSLGLAVLVTVYGSSSRDAVQHPSAGASAAQQAQHVFVTGADHAFLTAALFLLVTLPLVGFAIRPRPVAAS
jgi:MFS family permease